MYFFFDRRKFENYFKRCDPHRRAIRPYENTWSEPGILMNIYAQFVNAESAWKELWRAVTGSLLSNPRKSGLSIQKWIRREFRQNTLARCGPLIALRRIVKRSERAIGEAEEETAPDPGEVTGAERRDAAGTYSRDKGGKRRGHFLVGEENSGWVPPEHEERSMQSQRVSETLPRRPPSRSARSTAAAVRLLFFFLRI